MLLDMWASDWLMIGEFYEWKSGGQTYGNIWKKCASWAMEAVFNAFLTVYIKFPDFLK
jgi:hypothetical protein